MQNEWILDVLSDLKTFAQQNGMHVLAEHLNDTRLLAAHELALNSEGVYGDDCGPSPAAGPEAGTALTARSTR